MAEILFLAHRIPFPPDRGDKIRSWHVLRHLAERARVHLACFADDEGDAANLEGLRAALGAGLGDVHVEPRRVGKVAAAAKALRTGQPLSLTLFDSPAMRRFVHDKLAAGSPVDAVYAFSGQMAQFVPEPLRQLFVMDFVDMDSEKFAAYAAGGGLMRNVHAREAKRLFAFERAVAARADVSLFVSEAEAALFRRRTGIANVRALANGIDSGFFDPDANFPALDPVKRGETPILLFTGQMDYRPNVEAVSWFAAEILPLIPSAHFVIAGRNPAPEVTALAGARVTVTGAVDDMRTWLAAAAVVVAPLRIARGIQNKVLEAMAMARAVVASPAAFEGIEAEPGRHLVVEEGADAMAAAIRELLADPANASRIGGAARDLVARSYRWEVRLAPLSEMLGLTPPARAAA
ncbi:MAG TPA: TIGR03087 family PEP-CTERM/XrtA system glycosyltransferase [Allosphingosinicella sp.]|jgi:sugar transferase (PEP-CTERM/EpsH1 system associated)